MSYFLGSDNSNTVGTEARESEDGRLSSVSFWWEEPSSSQLGILVLLIRGHFLSEASSDCTALLLRQVRGSIQCLAPRGAPCMFPVCALTRLKYKWLIFHIFYLIVSTERLGTAPALFSNTWHITRHTAALITISR